MILIKRELMKNQSKLQSSEKEYYSPFHHVKDDKDDILINYIMIKHP